MSNLNLGLVVGKVYEVAMFQAERNQCGSNFGVTLKNFSKPKSTCTSVCGDGIVAASEACDLGTANNTARTAVATRTAPWRRIVATERSTAASNATMASTPTLR